MNIGNWSKWQNNIHVYTSDWKTSSNADESILSRVQCQEISDRQSAVVLYSSRS